MKASLVDLAAQYLSLKPELDEAVSRVLVSGSYVTGKEVSSFEQEYAAYCQRKYCIACSSGTDALFLAFEALATLYDISKAMIPVRTFIATAEAAIRAGLEVFLLDNPEEITYVPPEAIFVPVDLYGKPTRLNLDIRQEGMVVRDAAQSHGVKYQGDTLCYSFYPTKNLGAVGQAGAVVTDSENVRDLLVSLRSHGEGKERFKYEHLSGNYRIDELQAAILRVKLKHLDEWIARRREIAKLYRELITSERIKNPEDDPEHVYHAYVVGLEQRDSLAAYLAKKGVQTAVRYPIPLHLQPALEFLGYKLGSFPDAERWANENLSLPIFETMTEDQVRYVAQCVEEWSKS
mgnify:CR=1 FL=1